MIGLDDRETTVNAFTGERIEPVKGPALSASQIDRLIREAFAEGQKGGLGSGHWGHAGRPGQVGGSTSGRLGGSSSVNREYFTKGPGRKMVEGLDPKLRSAVIGVMVESGVQPRHLSSLNKITTEPSSDIVSTYDQAWPHGVGGVYDRFGQQGGGTIYINPDTHDSVTVMSHELGHHVTMGSSWAQGQSGVWGYQEGSSLATLEAGFESAKPLFRSGDFRKRTKIFGMGLRNHSMTNAQEFMADSWKVYQFGMESQKSALAEHLGVSNLDELFGG